MGELVLVGSDIGCAPSSSREIAICVPFKLFAGAPYGKTKDPYALLFN